MPAFGMMGADSMANPMMLGMLGGFGMAPFGMMGGEWPLSWQNACWQLDAGAEPHSAVATALLWRGAVDCNTLVLAAAGMPGFSGSMAGGAGDGPSVDWPHPPRDGPGFDR